MARPVPKTYGPALRYYVINRQGHVVDGPLRTLEQAQKVAEDYIDQWGEEPTITQRTIHPIADGEFIANGYHKI